MDIVRCMASFVATARAGSMTSAANELGLSPAIVGQHIAALEERLGTRLLNRTTRRQNLTDFGASYLDQCRDILDRIALAEESAQLQQTKITGRLRITAPTTFGAEALLPALGSYRSLAPEVEIDISLSDRNVDLIEEGFDVAFRIGAMEDSGLVAKPLASYRMMVCASPDYLERRGTPSHPADLASHEVIAFTPSARSQWKFIKSDKEILIAPPRTLTVNNGQGVRTAARAGLGIIMQPELLLRDDVKSGRLVRLFPDWRLRERPMWLLYHRDRHITPRLSSFISFAKTAFGGE